jgi:hypothetical protein
MSSLGGGLVKRSGTAIGQIPVYSSPAPVDFVYHWLRISWIEIFPGRLIDQSGDTFGRHLCWIRSIGYPVSSSVREVAGHLQVEIETSVSALSHLVSEESSLDPDAIFALSAATRTLALTFELVTDSKGFVVKRVQLRPHSAEDAAVIQRYGGRKEPYLWVAQSK